MLLKPMCCRTACIALVLITLSRKLASPVSRRDALNAELALLAQKSRKHSGPPRGPGDRIGGITVHTENCLLVLVPFLRQLRNGSPRSPNRHTPKHSQVGCCILLMDKFERFAIIKFRSGKCLRVTHSAMAAETCAFAEAFDAAFVLKHSLEKLLKRQIRLQLLTDSKQLFDAISHSTQTKEKRILIDIAALKQSFERHEISDLGLVAGRDLLADCFTKDMEPTQLMSAFESGFLRHEIKRWIIRDV
jgi:hypothetical protein